MLHHLSQFIRLHAAPSGAKERFVQLFFDVWNCARIHVILLRVSRTRRQDWLHFYQLGSCPKLNQLYVFQLDPGHDKGKYLYKDVGRSGYWSCKKNVGFASSHSAIKITSKISSFYSLCFFFSCNSFSSSLPFKHKDSQEMNPKVCGHILQYATQLQ